MIHSYTYNIHHDNKLLSLEREREREREKSKEIVSMKEQSRGERIMTS